MGRKITQKEIDGLEEYNKTHKYVSVEAYQDLLDWMPEMSDESLKNYWTTINESWHYQKERNSNQS